MKAQQPVKLVKTPQVVGVQEVPGSNPGGPTKFLVDLKTPDRRNLQRLEDRRANDGRYFPDQFLGRRPNEYKALRVRI